MPDRGLLDLNSVEPAELAPAPEAFVFERARWLQVTFEVARAAALRRLPPDVTRPIPCYGRLLVIDGSLGGRRAGLAALLAGGRFRMMPRNVLVEVVVDGPPGEIRRLLGTGVSEGTVRLERSGQRAAAEISRRGALLATATLPGLYAIEPTMLRWDPWLGVGASAGATVISESVVSPEFEAAYLSKDAAFDPDRALSPESPWRQFRNLTTISASYGEGTFALRGPDVQQPWS